MDRTDFMCTDWANVQAHLEDQIPFNPKLRNGMAMDTCTENYSSTVTKALAAFAPRSHLCDDPRPPILAGIQEEICLKNRLRKEW